MSLRKWSWSVGLWALLMSAVAAAEQTPGCVQDDPAVRQPAAEAVALTGAPGSLELAQSLSEAGDTAFERGDLASAEMYYRRAFTITRKLVPHSLVAAVRWNALGDVALERGELAKAKVYYEHALSIRRALAPGSRDFARSLISLGALARRYGEVLQEEAYFRQALTVGDALTPMDRADIFEGLGNTCSQRPCAQKPQDYFHRALQIREQLQPDSLALAGTLSFMGRSANAQGDLEEAQQDFAKALELRRRLAPGSLGLAASLNDLGVTARTRGNLALSELCLRQALQIRQRLAPHGLAVADSLHNLGIVYWLRDDLSSAQDYLDQTLVLRRKLIPDSPQLAQSFIWEGLLCVRRQELAEAQAYFGQALELLEKALSPDSLGVASVLTNLGNVARMRGELALSQQYYRRALEIQRKEAPDGPAEAGNLLALGNFLRQQGDLAGAESYIRRAVAIQERKVPDNFAHAYGLFALASLLRQERKEEDAEPLFAQAIDVLERQTASLGGTPEERSVFRARFDSNYKEYIELLISMRRFEQALRVLERARAWALLEMLARARVTVGANRDSDLDRLKRSLEEEIGAKSSYRIRLLDGPHTDAQLAELTRQLGGLRDRYRETEDQMQLRNPAYAALTHPQTLTGQEMQDLLDEDTLLLEYSLSPGRSRVWAVTLTTMAVYVLPSRDVIEKAAGRVRDLMTARSVQTRETESQLRKRLRLADAQYPAAARELSRLVLGPVAPLLQNKRIVIVPDGALQYLPFAALPAPSRDGADEPLVLEHEVANLPSATVLAELRRQALQRTPPPKAVVVLADPVFDIRDARMKDSDPPELAPGAYIDRLPWTRLEAAQILKVTPPGEGLEALDFDASRATALSPMLSQYRIVHFATHAISDSERPERSGLVLSLFDRNGQPQNGFLSLGEIYGLTLPADLVVLSACDTGLGREVSGEGLIGLVRGFMYAGATRVVASLWSVDDEVTAQLMAHFYKSLEQDGLSPAAALRAAQIEVRKQARWRSPYYWAGFQIEGEWR